jgi:micrococcal nuclease
LLEGAVVTLEADPTQQDRDRYNRLLRYVWLPNGVFFNDAMIRDGFAHEYTYQSKPYIYQEQFVDAENAARNNKSGLWADGVCKD